MNSVSICQVVESAASANGLPFEFFAQVIWQESRFRIDAVGPLTRTGHRAQGIAQFMPITAAERLLHDPFDPMQALPKSAEFLGELRAQFGNLGLAAAAYNAGPQCVRIGLLGGERCHWRRRPTFAR
jgi:soluble lytic murein transglycosylase-like protein